jgi:hypothetical protein
MMELTAYNWETLGTVAGATAATVLIVQYAKLPLVGVNAVVVAMAAMGGYKAGVSIGDKGEGI